MRSWNGSLTLARRGTWNGIPMEDKTMKPKIGQTAIFGPNTNMIGVVSAVRKNGF